jgi:5-formyltetrahydrofolate cyclo-ligase
MKDRQQLRGQMRQRRKAVPFAMQRAAATAIADHVRRARLLVAGNNIAVYGAIDGEVDLLPVMRVANGIGCKIYAPRIVDMQRRKMEFMLVPARSIQSASLNRLKSFADRPKNLNLRINPRFLDVVLVPLVAFDDFGWRLGFGAGFYDRKFAFKQRMSARKPLLIGVGYEFQRVERQEPNPWDVLLDAVVTECGIQRFRTRHCISTSLFT